MNTSISSFAILIAVLFVVGPIPCNSLECYDCSTISLLFTTAIPNCGDEFPENGNGIPKKTCPPKSVCNKVETSGKAGDIVTRGCFPDPFSSVTDSCTTGSNEQGESSNCFCTSNLCNGTEQRTVPSFLALLVSIGLIGYLNIDYFHQH